MSALKISRAQAEYQDQMARECCAADGYVSEALERARVVQILDAFGAKSGGLAWRMTDLGADCTPTCTLYPTVRIADARHFTAATPDEARAKAAAAIEAGEV